MVKKPNDTSEVSLHEQVLENLPDGVTVQDRDFNVIFQNATMKSAFGDRIGQKCYTSYEKREQICEGCGLEKVFATGKPVMVHRTGVMDDGSIGHWENSCFPLFDGEGNIVAGVEVCRNVTDRASLAQEVRNRTIELGKLNDQLNQQKQELEQKTGELKKAYEELQRTHTHMLQQEKMASIGQLAAGIAHEINTPIQFVGNNLAFLRDSFGELLSSMGKYQKTMDLANHNSEELFKQHEQMISFFEEADFDFLKTEIPLALEQTTDGVQRVAEIVLAMRSFSHSGHTSLGSVEVDELVNSTVEITRNAWKHVAELTLDLATPPVVVKGVKSELGQVLLNLVVNAVDAITDAKCPKEELGQIRIASRYHEGMGEILVEDSGCGIDEAHLGKVFEPFFTTKEVGRGTGQGLAIAYNIITEAHGGELLVESNPGKGSRFTIRLPLYEE